MKSAWGCAISGFRLFETLPGIYAEVAESIRERLRHRLSTWPSCRTCCSFGSWIGGDRDGNPLVKPECMRDALELARTLILREYIRDVEILERLPEFVAAPGGASAEIAVAPGAL